MALYRLQKLAIKLAQICEVRNAKKTQRIGLASPHVLPACADEVSRRVCCGHDSSCRPKRTCQRSARSLSTPELDQLRGHTRKVWPDDRRRRPPKHRQSRRRSIARSRDEGCRTANVLRPKIIPHMGRHHANRSRRYKQLLCGHVVDLGRGLKATYQINAQRSFKETVDTGVP